MWKVFFSVISFLIYSVVFLSFLPSCLLFDNNRRKSISTGTGAWPRKMLWQWLHSHLTVIVLIEASVRWPSNEVRTEVSLFFRHVLDVEVSELSELHQNLGILDLIPQSAQQEVNVNVDPFIPNNIRFIGTRDHWIRFWVLSQSDTQSATKRDKTQIHLSFEILLTLLTNCFFSFISTF